MHISFTTRGEHVTDHSIHISCMLKVTKSREAVYVQFAVRQVPPELCEPDKDPLGSQLYV